MIGTPVVANASVLPAPTAEESAVAERPYDGVELFSAIYFGSGSAVEAIPELDTMFEGVDTENAGMEQLRGELIDHLQEQDPEFFADFADGVYSGDHLTIQTTLQTSGEQIAEALAQMYPQAAAQGDITPNACTAVLGCVVTVVAAVNYAAAAAVAVAAVAWVTVASPSSAELDGDLLEQQIVDRIANDLGTAA
ncbi:hypothetical protein [Nocardiopsis sp. YSL2]|uniref:hypothetical protein n=1 Tax=Nocardiopsis sp. YSL2 TaxID=2939492 RepID=UPI0026F46B0A|nr:hypothetical protein [Nocardiopsis sp. YSL2]